MNKYVLGLLALLLAGMTPAAEATLSEIGSVTAQFGETGYTSAIIDTTGGFAYFGSSNSFVISGSTYGLITPTLLSPLTVGIAQHFYPRITQLQAAFFDPGTRYGYFVSSRAPSAIEAFAFDTSVAVSSMVFSTNQDHIGTAVIDTTHHLAYFGTLTSPSIVIKVILPDGVSVTSMTIVSTITLPAGLDYLSASVIDSQNGFAYFASSSTPGAVAKIKLADFTHDDTLTFNSGEGGVGSAVIDTTRQFAFFGTHDSPGKVIEVNLTGFSRIAAVTLASGADDLTSAIIDTAQSTAYFGTNTSPGRVVPVRLAPTLNTQASLTLATGENSLTSAVIDAANGYAYFGTFTNPGMIVQIDLLAGAPAITAEPSDATVHAGQTAFFGVTASGRNLTYQWYRDGAAIAGATSSSYSFQAVAADDGSAFNCLVTSANGSTTTRHAQLAILPEVKVYPNPWRSDRHAGVDIRFDGVLPNSTVKIFNLAAHWVKSLPTASGTARWDRTNDAGQPVATGYYIYIITTGNDEQALHGKLAIIK